MSPMPCVLFDAAGNSVLMILAGPSAPFVLSKEFVLQAMDHLHPYTADIVAVVRSDSPWSAEFANPDGSTEMVCGNALRSIPAALMLFGDARELISTIVHTSFGTISVSGTIETGLVEFPLDKVRVNGQIASEAGVLVEIGTPHRVRLVKCLVADEIETEGRALSSSSDPVNATFVSLARKRIELRTFERGVGETRSCGTGAMAAVVALWQSGFADLLPPSGAITAFLSGENLTVVLRESENRVSVSGRLTPVSRGLIGLPKGEVTWFPS